jgi:hypothetical protein
MPESTISALLGHGPLGAVIVVLLWLFVRKDAELKLLRDTHAAELKGVTGDRIEDLRRHAVALVEATKAGPALAAVADGIDDVKKALARRQRRTDAEGGE